MNPDRASVLTRGRLVVLALIALAGAGLWQWRTQGAPEGKQRGPVAVTSTRIGEQRLPVRLTASGQVAAMQSVEVRAQISATISAVHVQEGQSVKKGERLFSLDVRNEEAALARAQAQLAKSQAELANAERTLRRQRDLLQQKFVAQTALDAAQSQAESWRAQVAADAAAVQVAQVARSHGEIRAPIAGRTGAISVFPGSLVQPTGPALVSIAQTDPVLVTFSIAERDLPAVRTSMTQGAVHVQISTAQSTDPLTGELSFIDNSIDSASGTIRLKARVSNADGQLWPGMFVTVSLTPQVLEHALTVPAQAVQTGPEQRFVYVIGSDDTISKQPVTVRLIQEGIAVIDGAAAGTRVVVEGAQNLRPGSRISEAEVKAATP